MTYNKSEIMNRAWNLFRTGHYSSFAHTLKQAWAEAKRSAEQRRNGYVTANELSAGDTIAIEGYGCEGNNLTTTITAIETADFSDKYLVIRFILNNQEQNICLEPSEFIKRTAQAVAEVKAA